MVIRSNDQADIEAVTADYTARAAVHASDANAAAATLRAVGAGRLFCFLAIVAQAAAVVTGRIPTAVGWSLLAGTTGVFVVLIAWHRRVHDRERIHRALERACHVGIDRAHRRWNALPDARPIEFAADHAFAGDLHLTGQHSLAKLFPPMSPAAGIVMSEWLLAEEPPQAEALRSRQATVRMLVAQCDWRERLSVHAERLNGTAASLEIFFRWAESDPWLDRRRILRWTVRALTAVTLLALIAAAAHLIPVAVVLVIVIVNILVTGTVRRELGATLAAASSSGARLRGYGTLFRHAQTAFVDAPELRELGERIGGHVSGGAFSTLDQLAACGEVRLSTMGHYAMQALLLWDFHVVDALESWQRHHGRAVRGWVRALGEVESLAAFATLAHENPAWVFPSFHADAPGTLDASTLAHPLLPADVRIGNDVSLGPRGSILLVTGSNMAGKTTLLRAIALNVVLAQAGAPVCANALDLSRFRLRTSMHASDSLERGLSLFMAELVRLKAIVDAANTASDCALLYLADEILRGTNAVDRHSAIVTVLGTLTRAGAVGVVATHDPDLAHAATLEHQMRAVNLIEQFRDGPHGPLMWFDYRLRPGVATTRNAIKLLEMVGLGASPPEA
jgi:hypothetical protein